MTEAERAYAAGLMDGEGCFTILRRHQRTEWFVAAVNVTNSERSMVEWLQERWGGSIYARPSRSPRTGLLGKTSYHWSLSAKLLEPFLADVQPYLIVKSAQCRLLRVLRALTIHRGRGRLGSPALSALHRRIYEKSLALKRAA